MKKISVLIIVLFLLTIVSSSFADQKSKSYISLLSKDKTQSGSHIIVQATPKVPKDWKMEWVVLLSNPKGSILPVGKVNDYLGAENRKLVIEVPPGQYRIEIARRNDAWTMDKKGHYLIRSGKWVPATPQLVAVTETSITLSKNEITVLKITYENPRVDSTKTDRGKTIIVHTWENMRLARAKGAVKDLPSEDPGVYPLIKYASFADIDQSHLVTALKNNSYSPAAGALLRASDPNIKLIIQGLEEGTLELTSVVARILAKSRNRRSTKTLTRILKNGPQKSRHIATWVLGELQDNTATKALVDALNDKSALVRNYACYALAGVKDEQAVDALIKSLKDQSSVRVDFLFVDAWPSFHVAHFVTREGISGESLPIPFLSVRRNAIYALGQIRDPRAIDSIIRYLEDSQLDTRIAAIYALGNFDSQKSVNALVGTLEHGESERWLATKMLGKIGDKKAIESLREIVKKDADENVRQAAEQAIQEILKADR